MRGNGAGRAVNSKELCAQLVELERAAAHCGALLADAPPELVERVVAAFAPSPAARGPEQTARTWLGWIAECHARHGDQEQGGPPPGAVEDVILRWCLT
jgi:hypothetical protein